MLIGNWIYTNLFSLKIRKFSFHSNPPFFHCYTPINITVCLLFHASLLYNTRYNVAKYLFHIYRDMSQCMHFYIYHTLNYAHILPSSSLLKFYFTFIHVYLFNIVLNYIIIISFLPLLVAGTRFLIL